MEQYKISSNLAISETGFLFSPSTGDSFTLNEMGLIIIELIKTNKTKSEIIEIIVNEFDVDRNSTERDITDFISQLSNFNLLVEV